MSLSQPMLSSEHNIEFNDEEIRKLSMEMSKINVDIMSQGKSHTTSRVHVPKDLETCEKVWLRTDRVRRPLEAPYTGPYEVLQRLPKCYVIDINGKKNTVSIDRLKPAYTATNPENHRPNQLPNPSPQGPLENTEPGTNQREEVVTRYGRRVKFRTNLNTYH